jgi:hypothetical protein
VLNGVLDEFDVPDADSTNKGGHQAAIVVPEEILDDARRLQATRSPGSRGSRRA